MVKYANLHYIGKVISVDGIAGYRVQTLTAGMGNCFWWSKENPIWYEETKILSSVVEPIPCNNRANLKLSDKDFLKFKSFK